MMIALRIAISLKMENIQSSPVAKYPIESVCELHICRYRRSTNNTYLFALQCKGHVDIDFMGTGSVFLHNSRG